MHAGDMGILHVVMCETTVIVPIVLNIWQRSSYVKNTCTGGFQYLPVASWSLIVYNGGTIFHNCIPRYVWRTRSILHSGTRDQSVVEYEDDSSHSIIVGVYLITFQRGTHPITQVNTKRDVAHTRVQRGVRLVSSARQGRPRLTTQVR